MSFCEYKSFNDIEGSEKYWFRHILKLNFNERTLHPPEKKISEDSDDERMSKCALTAVK